MQPLPLGPATFNFHRGQNRWLKERTWEAKLNGDEGGWRRTKKKKNHLLFGAFFFFFLNMFDFLVDAIVCAAHVFFSFLEINNLQVCEAQL